MALSTISIRPSSPTGCHTGVVLEAARHALAFQQETQQQNDLGDDLVLSQIVAFLHEDVQRILSSVPTVNSTHRAHR